MKYLFAALAVLLATSALAQPGMNAGAPPSPVGAASLCSTCYAPLSANSSVSTAIQIPAPSPPYGALTIFNDGLNDAFIAQGNSTVAATLSSPILRAGKCMTIQVGNDQGAGYISALTASGSTVIDVYQANASLLLQCGGSSGGGGTGNQGSPNAGGPSGAWFIQGCSSCAPTPVTAAALPLPANGAQENGGNLAATATNTGTIATESTAIAASTAATATNTAALSSSSGATATNTNNTAASSATTAAAVANAGATPSKAMGVQGVSGGTAVGISAASLPLPSNAAVETGGNLAGIASSNTAIATSTGSTATSSSTTATNTGNVATNTAGAAAGSPETTHVKSIQGCPSCTPVTVFGQGWSGAYAPTLGTVSPHAQYTCLGTTRTITVGPILNGFGIRSLSGNWTGNPIQVVIATSAFTQDPCAGGDGSAFNLSTTNGDVSKICEGCILTITPQPLFVSSSVITDGHQSNLGLGMPTVGGTATVYVDLVTGVSGYTAPAAGDIVIDYNGG